MEKAISLEQLRHPELDVVQVSLRGIPDHNRLDVMSDIHDIYIAEKVNDILTIKVSINSI